MCNHMERNNNVGGVCGYMGLRMEKLHDHEEIESGCARVGTVDKFQGQEAEAVLVSMTTSSGEYLPRDIDFLYSKNRLNVAISRARCWVGVVASARLLDVNVKSPVQMALVNTLCWVREYAQQESPGTISHTQ